MAMVRLRRSQPACLAGAYRFPTKMLGYAKSLRDAHVSHPPAVPSLQ
jgi:hypothetical protein